MRAAVATPRETRRDNAASALGIACIAAALGAAFVVVRMAGPLHPPVGGPAGGGPALVAPPAAWVAINRPLALFGLPAPELRGLPLGHQARRHRDGAREDVLAYGAFSGDGLHLRLAIATGAADPAPVSFFVDLVRHAAEAGYAIARVGTPDAVATKFGQAETADVTLEGTVDRDCLAFRDGSPDGALQLRGWLCGTRERPADRQGLACLLDRLSLKDGHDDPALDAIFAAARERRRPDCLGRASWLEAPLTASLLRGSVTPE